MKLSDYHFNLPQELIAQYPTEDRTASRLLVLDGNSGEVKDETFKNIVDYLNPGDLLVMNNTKVIAARLNGQKDTGGRVEVLVERVLSDHEVLAQVRASKAPKPGAKIFLNGGTALEVIGREDEFFHLKFLSDKTVYEILDAIGEVPLPPYIERTAKQQDKDRYQTVYAQTPGAVAAPTAGLHFDNELLANLKAKGIDSCFVTLHVGAGTFQPVRIDDLTQHKMHKEWIEVSADTVDKIKQTRIILCCM